MSAAAQRFESVREEDLRPGDVIDLIGGPRMITAIRPYVGTLSDVLFAVADLAGYRCGISLERGGFMDRLVTGGAA